ncbi:uracil/xanthine transporter [Paenibacillus agri]|uniref:Uracil/xanthine transporter n=1 Tax=Paenibacillus agri TaxID=2744309 RepID=A0A850EIA0_9BACL|nr:uracil/xanthine transporter [Paenibacillus agri]NUU60106.1 uracil/xanthine transporter [Paenibacillus agri]
MSGKRSNVANKQWLGALRWVAGLQWFFFLFTNTVVIPITVGAAFRLGHTQVEMLVQISFVLTGIASVMQAAIGHRRAIMEGQSGLWWGVILGLCAAAPSIGRSLQEVGASLAVGVVLSGVVTILLGVMGWGAWLARLFTARVMAVFMFLLGCRLNLIFLEGMMGISPGMSEAQRVLHPAVFGLASAVALLTIWIVIKGGRRVAPYALLIGIVAGWAVYAVLFGAGHELTGVTQSVPASVTSEGAGIGRWLFPVGMPQSWGGLDIGVILIAVIAGLVNTSNTFGAIKGTDDIYEQEADDKTYRRSFTISGVLTVLSGVLGTVPYAPYVSSIGFLQQTRIRERLPFVLGALLFMIVGLIPVVSDWMTLLPLSIGSAVLLVTYVRLLFSSLNYFRQVRMEDPVNLYAAGIPLFVGVILMGLPAATFVSLPALLRPLLGNGLLVGILLALLMELIPHRPERLASEADVRAVNDDFNQGGAPDEL